MGKKVPASHDIESTPGAQGVVPDYVDRGGTAGQGFRQMHEGQGVEIDKRMAREQTKQSNLRARLTDLGVDVGRREQCFVHAAEKPEDDTITMPWSVIYFLIESDYAGYFDSHRMGVQS